MDGKRETNLQWPFSLGTASGLQLCGVLGERWVISVTNPATPSAVEHVLRHCPVAAVAFDLETQTVIGANEAAHEFFGEVLHRLESAPISHLVSPGEWDAAAAALQVLSSGSIEGYRTVRHFERPDGTDTVAHVWVRLVEDEEYKFGLVGIEPRSAPIGLSLFDSHFRMAIITTDHDWVIEHVSTDVDAILGHNAEFYKGTSLLGLLRPTDAQTFMEALDRVVLDEGGTTLRMHLRAAGDRWQEVCSVVMAMCRHAPPRIGLAFAATPGPGLELAMRCYREVSLRGGDMAMGMAPIADGLLSEGLSTRQWDILMRLVRGERAQEIAADLYLSPSTVRNHLTAIYRKFGVHSQAELLAKLLEARR